MDCNTPGFPVFHYLWEFAQIHVHGVYDAIQPSHLLSPLSSPALTIFPSIRVFSNEFVLHIRWPKYWSFSFSISPSNEYWGLISFRIDWLDLFAVQGTLKSLLQNRSSKASILWHSAFFMEILYIHFFFFFAWWWTDPVETENLMTHVREGTTVAAASFNRQERSWPPEHWPFTRCHGS